MLAVEYDGRERIFATVLTKAELIQLAVKRTLAKLGASEADRAHIVEALRHE